ncbi:MAG: DNA replication and repair protein RecF [Candidatus Levybacteria bacterium]|nr:DNA replication and repair protein RecF [Candidatus Levybacteria bacterium]
MFLKYLFLQNFRSYKKSEFFFNQNTTFVIGSNTTGKTNLIESIYFLSSGKSFRTEKDSQLIQFGENLARIKGKTTDTDLEIILTDQRSNGRETPFKKFLVNGVSKRRVDFSSNLVAALFSPEDLDIITGSPSLRRNFLDNVLEQVDREYHIANITYTKALRQRNALLDVARETGNRNEKQFEYWDLILIKNGGIITQKREELIEFINSELKDIFDFAAIYDKSIISKARLLQYKDAEVGAGVTLVGPQRDDFIIEMFDNVKQEACDVKFFGSRGQQRLVVLQLKFLELSFIEKALGFRPVFLLDDIFSELDSGHIKHILGMIDHQQTIITTTHEEFIPKSILVKAQVIELSK